MKTLSIGCLLYVAATLSIPGAFVGDTLPEVPRIAPGSLKGVPCDGSDPQYGDLKAVPWKVADTNFQTWSVDCDYELKTDTFDAGAIGAITLPGVSGKLRWEPTDSALPVQMPRASPGACAFLFRVSFKTPAIPKPGNSSR